MVSWTERGSASPDDTQPSRRDNDAQEDDHPRRKLHRRQAVAYYRGSTDGDDGDSIAAQKEIVGRWAAETGHEIVEEVIDRATEATPAQPLYVTQ